MEDKKDIYFFLNTTAADDMTPQEARATVIMILSYPDSKVHGASMGPIWGRQDPDGPHVGLMNFAIRVVLIESSGLQHV